MGMPYSDTEANQNSQANVLCRILRPLTADFSASSFLSFLFRVKRRSLFNRHIPFWDEYDNAQTS